MYHTSSTCWKMRKQTEWVYDVLSNLTMVCRPRCRRWCCGRASLNNWFVTTSLKRYNMNLKIIRLCRFDLQTYKNIILYNQPQPVNIIIKSTTQRYSENLLAWSTCHKIKHKRQFKNTEGCRVVRKKEVIIISIVDV